MVTPFLNFAPKVAGLQMRAAIFDLLGVKAVMRVFVEEKQMISQTRGNSWFHYWDCFPHVVHTSSVFCVIEVWLCAGSSPLSLLIKLNLWQFLPVCLFISLIIIVIYLLNVTFACSFVGLFIFSHVSFATLVFTIVWSIEILPSVTIGKWIKVNGPN